MPTARASCSAHGFRSFSQAGLTACVRGLRAAPSRCSLLMSGEASPRSSAMDDYALVLNAGSSSLKFCVFQRPSGKVWRLESRGQIDGIGTSPRFSAKDADGELLTNENLSVRDGREAVDSLAKWLRSKYGGSRVVGVGHRV